MHFIHISQIILFIEKNYDVKKQKENYVVASVKSWNIKKFKELTPELPGNWTMINGPEELTHETLGILKPKYIFFPHWSWIVPQEIFRNYTCVCFHMTDVPYGRGGSPLQNLIVRGHRTTKITALRMCEELDAGDVYTKHELALTGTAQEILLRATNIIWKIIPEIVSKSPTPVPQEGDVFYFKRRKPSEGNLESCENLEQIYDYIRMLDGEGYPRAFLGHSNFKYEFENVSQDRNFLYANVRIKRIKDK